MPIPKPNKNEQTKDFIARCMGNDIMVKDYKDNGQRYAVCISQTRNQKNKSESSILVDIMEALNDILEYEEGFVDDELDLSNVFIPSDEDYLDFDEEVEDYEFSTFKFIDPITEEVFLYDRMGNWQKNGRRLIFRGQSAEKTRRVKLNKPFRTPDGPKKFSVYVKNEKGNVVKVNFGDPNMTIKKNIPSRRKSFRARMRCDSPGPKWKARYWACKSW